MKPDTRNHRPCCDVCGEEHRTSDCPDLPPGYRPPRESSKFHTAAKNGKPDTVGHRHAE